MNKTDHRGTPALPTIRETPNGQHPPLTHRETPRGGEWKPDNQTPVFELLAELAGQYRTANHPPHTSAEGTLFKVEDKLSGERRMLKIYHPHVELKPESLTRIQAVASRQVVRVVNWGQLPDGRWWETQEYVEGEGLLGFRDSQPDSVLNHDTLIRVVAELVEGVDALHQAGIAHHDIKPGNILVRQTDPIQVVLVDYGLTVVADSRTYYATSRNATIDYQAPETMRNVGGEPRDWWAVGLTIATLATGNTPYAGLNEYAILDQHHKQTPPPIVENMSDSRIRQLCQGLTRYDTTHRWGAPQIRQWLNGDNPPITSETPGIAGDSTAVRFNNRDCATPQELAEELSECWTLAVKTLGVSASRDDFMGKVITAYGTERLARMQTEWEKTPPTLERIDHAIVELIVALHPNHKPVYANRRLTVNSVKTAGLSNQPEDQEFVAKLHRSQALEAWGRHTTHPDLLTLVQEWKTTMDSIRRISRTVTREQATLLDPDKLRGTALAVTSDDDMLKKWKALLGQNKPKGTLVPAWYKALLKNSDPANIVAAVLLAGEGKREQKRARKKRQAEPTIALAAALSWLASVLIPATTPIARFLNRR